LGLHSIFSKRSTTTPIIWEGYNTAIPTPSPLHGPKMSNYKISGIWNKILWSICFCPFILNREFCNPVTMSACMIKANIDSPIYSTCSFSVDQIIYIFNWCRWTLSFYYQHPDFLICAPIIMWHVFYIPKCHLCKYPLFSTAQCHYQEMCPFIDRRGKLLLTEPWR